MTAAAHLSETFYECRRHVEKIRIAKRNLQGLFPLNPERYEHLKDAEQGFIDQLVFRFSKLQDTIGEKIFPGILILGGEQPKSKTFIDILNRMEALGIIDRREWLHLRELRNEIAHEYSFNKEAVVRSLQKIFEESDRLLQIHEGVFEYCRRKFPEAISEPQK